MGASQFVVVLFGLGYLGYILYTRKRADFSEFSVAGRGLGTFLIFASMAATWIGPALTMGLVREGFNSGWLYLPFGLLSAVNLLAIGYLFSPQIRTRFTDAYSIGDIVGGVHSHDSRSVKFVAGALSFLFLCVACTIMSKAGGELVNNVFGFPITPSIVIITVIVTLYSCLGGIRATIQTDAFQFLNFAILIPLLLVLMMLDQDFSFGAFKAASVEQTAEAWDGHTASALFGLSIFWLLRLAVEPAYFNRVLSSGNPGVARRATLYNAGFAFVWMFLMLGVGNAGQLLHAEVPDSDQLLLNLAEFHYHDIMYGLFIVAMIGVVMSTQDSLLNTASIIFTVDMMAVFRPAFTDRQRLLAARVSTLCIGGVALLIAIYVDSVLAAVIWIFSVYIPTMLPTLVCSIYAKRPHWQAALVSMAIGFGSSLYWEFAGLNEIAPGSLVCLVFSASGYGLVYMAMRGRRSGEESG